MMVAASGAMYPRSKEHVGKVKLYVNGVHTETAHLANRHQPESECLDKLVFEPQWSDEARQQHVAGIVRKFYGLGHSTALKLGSSSVPPAPTSDPCLGIPGAPVDPPISARFEGRVSHVKLWSWALPASDVNGRYKARMSMSEVNPAFVAFAEAERASASGPVTDKTSGAEAAVQEGGVEETKDDGPLQETKEGTGAATDADGAAAADADQTTHHDTAHAR